jgi:uncharacterized protein with GYD domain
MARFVLLLKFTEKGITGIKDSPNRADQFRAKAGQMGVTVESQYWLLGEHDGLMILSAPSEEKITALALHLGSLGFVRTCLCRAYDEGEFKGLLGNI